MKTLIAAGILGVSALFAVTPVASAGPNDAQLCSFNLAYRTGHKSECAAYDINSIGHGGWNPPAAPAAPPPPPPAPTGGTT